MSKDERGLRGSILNPFSTNPSYALHEDAVYLIDVDDWISHEKHIMRNNMIKIRLKAMALSGFLSWLVLSGIYTVMIKMEMRPFGYLYRMFMYHYQHPYQYIGIICFFYSIFIFIFIHRIARGGCCSWICSALILLAAPLVASPFGGMLWHYHDMQAGFFPPYAVNKVLSGFSEGLALGWLIVGLSIPYNLIGMVIGIPCTVWLARILSPAKNDKVVSGTEV